MSASGTRYGQTARLLLWVLAGLLALGVAGSLMMSVRARNDAQKQIVVQAETIVQRSLTLAFDPTDLEAPVSAERAAQLSQHLTSIVLDPSDFTKVTLYNADGTILYATELSRIGTQLVGEQGRIQEALKGIVQNRAVDGQFSTLMSFRFPSGVGRPSAVELVRDDAPLTSAVAPWRTTALFLGLVLILLALVAWGVNRIAAAASTAAAAAAANQPRVPTPQPTPSVPVLQPGLREEGEARRRAEERARDAEDRVGLLQEQYRKTLEELQQYQTLAREPHAADPALEERALRAEGQVATLQQQLALVQTEREQLAQALHAGGRDPVAAPEEIAAQQAALRDAQQEAMRVRAELDGAQAQVEALQRELAAARAAGSAPGGDRSATHAELARTKDDLSTTAAQLRSAQRELEDARAELRALRTEEQRAAMLEDELRVAKAAADSIEASHRAELVEREAELEEKVRVTREEFQRQLEDIEASYKNQLGKREAALAGRIAEAEAQARESAREVEAMRAEIDAARAEATSREQRLVEATDEIRTRRSEVAALQGELDERRRAAEAATGLAEEAGHTAEELQAEIGRAHEAVAQLRAELTAERAAAAEAADRAERAERERAALTAQSAQLGRELDAAGAENADLNRRLQEIEARRQLELADDQGRAEIDDLLRVTQERLAGQTEKLMAAEDRVRDLESELTSANERIEVTETELRTHRMSEALKEMRDPEHGDASVDAIAVAPRAIEDRRSSTPFTKELSLDAKKNLARIMGITQILKHKKDAKEQAQLIKQLTTYARRLDHTVADLAEAERLAHGDIALQIKRADLEALVHRVVEESGADGERDIRVVTEPLTIGVDAHRVEQILAGLLRNSADRTTGGKEIVVRAVSSDGGALLSVEDGETSSDASLSPVVKRFAEAHGGWAKVEGRPDGGSAFRVFLPDGSPVSDDVKVLVDAPQADVWDDSAEKILVQELHRLAEAEGSEEKVKSGRSRRAGRRG
ncbi:MAG TPA: hypothetical protein VLA82_14670 [Actinomycetota bacterium]|nr:hypothetical protein [Actinomycetota bacterium]